MTGISGIFIYTSENSKQLNISSNVMPNQDIVLGVETEFNEIANRIITYDKPDAKI